MTSPARATLLEVRGIDVFYGDVQVLWEVSFEVREGEILVLVGANGAGKSTTLKTISALLKPARGSISFQDRALHTLKPYEVLELGVAQSPRPRLSAR